MKYLNTFCFGYDSLSEFDDTYTLNKKEYQDILDNDNLDIDISGSNYPKLKYVIYTKQIRNTEIEFKDIISFYYICG